MALARMLARRETRVRENLTQGREKHFYEYIGNALTYCELRLAYTQSTVTVLRSTLSEYKSLNTSTRLSIPAVGTQAQ
jgi:hypothetical protein